MGELISGLFLLFTVQAFGQQPVTDHANAGQMKRMVFQQWDDWKPTPDLGLFGIPQNPEGFLYWKILHKKYHSGPDSRPYKTGGTFEKNYASLTLQEKDDKLISDSMQKVAETNAATYAGMSGGAADVAWTMYFKKQFEALYDEIPNRLLSIASKYPVAATRMVSNKHYKDYQEYLAITKDRVTILHNAFVDKGDRIVSYLTTLKELRHHNEVMNQMINNYIQLTKLPSVQQVAAANKKTIIYPNDAQIIKHILSTFNF